MWRLILSIQNLFTYELIYGELSVRRYPSSESGKRASGVLRNQPVYRKDTNDVFDGVALDSQQDFTRSGISSIKAKVERSLMLC